LTYGLNFNGWTIAINWLNAVPSFPNTPGEGGGDKNNPQSSPTGDFLDGWDFFPPESTGVTII